MSGDPSALTDIYSSDSNIAVWSRQLPTALIDELQQTLIQGTNIALAREIEANTIKADLESAFASAPVSSTFVDHVAELVDMFSCLFELPQVGMRLRTLDKPMCPKFHVDKVPCRLVTTFVGNGTEWLPQTIGGTDDLPRINDQVSDNDRHPAGLADDIQYLACGDVALLKGERWEGNEGRGLIHRSPSVSNEAPKRLLMTLDFM